MNENDKKEKKLIINMCLLLFVICIIGILLNANIRELEVNSLNRNCLKENIASTMNESSSSDGKYSIFGKEVTSLEVLYSATYPAQALVAMNASKEASVKAKEYYELGLYLGNGDAFRHSYWNDLMEKRISKTILINIGTPSTPNYVPQEIDFAKMIYESKYY